MLSKVPLDRIRDVLYNIEQFKADALKLPNINTNFGRKERGLGSSKSSSLQEGPVYGAAAKSAGSLNEKTSSGATKMLGGGNQGQTSLTGKNPFAILKASAIASTSSAVFPNNFTNLPKVSPPFLDALESGEEGNVYTLVLDLDETLIHNVEVCNPNPSVYFTRSLFFSTFTAFNTARLAISISALVDLNFAAYCLIFTGWSFQKS